MKSEISRSLRVSLNCLLASTALILPAAAETLPPDPPAAQQADPSSGVHGNILEEVIVTGSRRRAEDVQKTPLAITAVDAKLLERDHVTNFTQIGQLAPNLQVFHNLGAALADVYLRGFGENSNDPNVEPHVATLIDGVYLPDTVGNLFDMWDVCNLEVDAGPQGTLKGKNAAIGAIEIQRCKPTNTLSGEVQADYGSYDHVGARGWFNLPVIQDETGASILAMRFVASYKEGGNWIYNLANGKRDMGGENERSGRVLVSFTPTPEFSWDVSADLDLNRQPQVGNVPRDNVPAIPGTNSNATQGLPLSVLIPGLGVFPLGPLYFGGAIPNYPYGTTDSTYTRRSRLDMADIFSTMSYKFDPVTVTSVSGYANFWLEDNVDDGGLPFPALNSYHSVTEYDFESEELRLSSNKGGGWDLDGFVDWVIGGYFSNYNINATGNLAVLEPPGTPLNMFAANASNASRIKSQSEAAFAHVIFNFNSQWTGTFGVRMSWDQKAHSLQPVAPYWPSGAQVSGIPVGFHNTSFEVGTAYQFDQYRMAYFRFAQGYQAGGIVGGALNQSYQPELNNEYEIGFKADWLDKRLRTNLVLFYNDLSQLQVESALPIPTAPGFLQTILNAGSATVEGMEAQIVALPTENLTTHLTAGYLHPRYNQFHGTSCSNTLAAADCSGLPFSDAPKWTLNLGADYVLDLPADLGTATFSVDWDYRSALYISDPVYPYARQEGYGLVNAGVKLQDPSETYALEFYGTNILNRHYRLAFTDPSSGAPNTAIAAWDEDGRPAEWGIRVTAKF